MKARNPGPAIALFGCVAGSCASSGATTTQASVPGETADAPLPGMTEPAGACVDTPMLRKPARETFRRTVPRRDRKHGTLVCAGGHDVWFDADRLRVCTVAHATIVRGIPVAAGAYTHLFGNGAPAQTTLARVHVLSTAAGRDVTCAPGGITLAENGSLESCTADHSEAFGRVTLQAAQRLTLHPGGELASGTIARRYVDALRTFEPGSRLRWHPHGSLAGGYLSAPTMLGSHLARAQFRVHPNGQLARFDLARDEVIAGHEFKAFSTVQFRGDGSLEAATVTAESGFMPHGERWEDGAHIRFDCDGQEIERRSVRHQETMPEPAY